MLFTLDSLIEKLSHYQSTISPRNNELDAKKCICSLLSYSNDNDDKLITY